MPSSATTIGANTTTMCRPAALALTPPYLWLDQQYSDDMTWQDYFLQNACTSIQQIEALKAAATEAGFTMPEEYQTEYESTIASMADYAVQAGFTDSDGNGDVLAYIQDSYGSAATEDSFAQYLYDSYYVTAYSDEIYKSPQLHRRGDRGLLR